VGELNPADDLPRKRPERYGVLFYVGAAGLIVAMAVEAVAVVGRQIGEPLLGAIEIIQTAMLLTASSAMLSATLADTHAKVHLLVDRLPSAAQRWLQRFATLLSAAFFAALAVASVWLTIESWNTHEESELLRIPYRPLRIIAAVMVAAIACVFIYRTLRRAPRDPQS
jgi:TRAP-type C4-dicarboxylate transport system permease small subunit